MTWLPNIFFKDKLEVYAFAASALLLSSTLERPSQLANELLPMLVTFSGMVTEVKQLQFANALCPMLVILLGIVIDVKPLQP